MMRRELDPVAGSDRKGCRKWLILTLLLGLILAAGLGLGRDLPRRAVVQTLAVLLGAEVDLEALRFERAEHDIFDHIVLDHLRLRELRDFPTIDEITLRSLSVTATWRELIRLRWRTLQLSGMVVDVDASRALELPPTRLDLQIDQILFEDFLLRLRNSAGGDILSEVQSQVEILDYGREPSLEWSARSEVLDVGRALRVVLKGEELPVVGQLVRADLHWTLDIEASNLRLEAEKLELNQESTHVVLERLRLKGRTVGAKTTWEVEADPAEVKTEIGRLRLPQLDSRWVVETTVKSGLFLQGDVSFVGVEKVHGSARRALTGDWRDVNLRVEGLDLSSLQGPWHLAEDASKSPWHLDAEVDLQLRGDEEALDFEIDGRMAQWPDFVDPYLRGRSDARVQIDGTTRIEDPAGRVDVVIQLPTVQGELGAGVWPEDLFPARLEIGGDYAVASRSFQGGARFQPRRGGELAVTGELDGAADSPRIEARWDWQGSEIETLLQLFQQAGGSPPEIALSGRLQADGVVNGAISDPSLEGEVRFGEVRMVPPGSLDPSDVIQLSDGEGILTWKRRHSVLPWTWRLLPTSGSWTWQDSSPRPLTLEAAGTIGADLSLATFDGLRLDLDDLGIFRGAGTWTSAPRPDARGSARQRLDARLQLTEASLPAWVNRLGLFALEEGSSLGGSVSGDWELFWEPPKGWRLVGPVELTGGGYASSDGARVVDGLRGQWELHLAQEGEASPTFAARGTAGRFQLLWNTFYGDLSTVESQFDLAGRLDPMELVLSGSLPEGPRFEASLDIPTDAPQNFDVGLDFKIPDLERTHERYLQPLLQDALGNLALAGKLDLETRLLLQDGEMQSARGSLRLDEVHLTTSLPLQLESFTLDLPFDLHRRADSDGSPRFHGRPLDGHLGFERLGLRDLDLPAIDSPLVIEGDAFALQRPLEMKTLGGKLALESLAVERLLSSERALTSSLRWSDVRLDLLSERLELMPLDGVLEAYLPRIRLNADGELDVTGDGEARLFGGRVTVREISGRDLFTRFPKMAFSADFERLDLGQLTGRFDFGEMTGLLNGTIEDAELFRGVPTAFAARFETLREKGVKQKLDLKAVKNLTILGTGSSPSVFDRGLLSFFDTYRYDGFGFSVQLVNDALTIRGLEARGDRQLFLRGRWPLRIDIVNARPKAEVSFRGMLDRLRNLDLDAIQTN